MNNLTEQQKRMLTEEVLGACWHDIIAIDCRTSKCVKCNKPKPTNRTFDNQTDLWDLEQAIHRMGLWVPYSLYLVQHYAHLFFDKPYGEINYWSHDPARCLTIAEWWEERKGKEK